MVSSSVVLVGMDRFVFDLFYQNERLWALGRALGAKKHGLDSQPYLLLIM